MRIALATILGIAASWAANMGILQAFMPKVEEGADQYAAMLEMIESFTAVDYLNPLAAHVFGVLAGLIVARLMLQNIEYSNLDCWWIAHAWNRDQHLHDSSTNLVHYR
ncbi:MAG: hypothetical protein P8P74_13325 [Crocinitomicaceae bacterium]|nr:hypothetical protein [Crocinitomicaceae bacterium]